MRASRARAPLLAFLLAGFAGHAHSIPIGLGGFSGGETVETFNSLVNGAMPNPFVLNGVTYTSDDTWSVQPGGSLFNNIPGSSGSPTINTGTPPSTVFIDFSTTVNRAGLLLSAGGPSVTSWDVSVFGAGLVLLETISVVQPGLSDAVFAGIERSENIVRLQAVRTGGPDTFFTFIDDVRYESTVPEPGTGVLLGIALTVLGIRRKPI